jgi:hypothetical protein
MMKSGANVLDIEQIKKLYAAGESVETISRAVLVLPGVVQTFIDELEAPEESDDDDEDEDEDEE